MESFRADYYPVIKYHVVFLGSSYINAEVRLRFDVISDQTFKSLLRLGRILFKKTLFK